MHLLCDTMHNRGKSKKGFKVGKDLIKMTHGLRISKKSNLRALKHWYAVSRKKNS